MAVRPSGTEPKIKVYYSIVDASKENAGKRLEIIRNEIKSIIKRIIWERSMEKSQKLC